MCCGRFRDGDTLRDRKHENLKNPFSLMGGSASLVREVDVALGEAGNDVPTISMSKSHIQQSIPGISILTLYPSVCCADCLAPGYGYHHRNMQASHIRARIKRMG